MAKTSKLLFKVKTDIDKNGFAIVSISEYHQLSKILNEDTHYWELCANRQIKIVL